MVWSPGPAGRWDVKQQMLPVVYELSPAESMSWCAWNRQCSAGMEVQVGHHRLAPQAFALLGAPAEEKRGQG